MPCVQSWHSLDALPHHLPFDDGFCLPFGIPSQKGGVHCRVFVFRERVFCWLELVEFRLYLGASHCILSFSSCCVFDRIFMLVGVLFFVTLYVSCFKLFIDLYL